jgi:TonB family protein
VERHQGGAVPRSSVFALISLASLHLQTPDRIEPSAAAQFIGQTKRVCGPVAGRRGGIPADKAPTLLDLGGVHPNQALIVSITPRARRDIVKPFEERSERLDVCATGRITSTNEGLVLRIDDAHLLVGTERRPADRFRPDLPRPAERSQEGLVGPQPMRTVNPKYTDAAKKARIEGMVEIEAVILADGTVGETRVVKSIDAVLGLDDEAVKAFRAWKFMPATKFGQPIACVVVGVLRFDLFLERLP